MPTTPGIKVLRTWRFGSEPNRIHYVLQNSTRRRRHLYVDAGHPLYEMLEEELRDMGYEGPKSAGN